MVIEDPFLYLIIRIIGLYKFILIIYIIATWLINFNLLNTSNRFIFTTMGILYRLSEPSLKLVRRYIPSFGNVDISPIIVFIFLEFLQRFIIKYWPG